MKMEMTVVALSVASASAFVAPTSLATKPLPKPALRMELSGSEFAATLPGAPFSLSGTGQIFDPVGFTKSNDVATIKRFREAELKHGRVAMLAALGILVAESFHPLFMMPDFIGPAVYHFQEIEGAFNLFWVAALTAIAVVEGDTIQKGWDTVDPLGSAGQLKPDYQPGDIGFDPLGLCPGDPAEFAVMQTKELNNGRLAMIGVAGMLVQELVDNRGILTHFQEVGFSS